MIEDSDDAGALASPGLATVLGGGLMLPKIALQQLFALPGDALPQGITRLTGLTQNDVQRFCDFRTSEEYDHALRHEPALFYYFALTGWLAYNSALGEAIRERLHGAGTAKTAETVQVAELVTEGIIGLLAGCVPTATADTTEALHALFAQEKYGLTPCLPALVPPAPPLPATGSDDSVWLTIQPEQSELSLFGMALHLTRAATYGVPHPLGEAVGGVAALGTPAELLDLARRFNTAQTALNTELALTGPDALRLYLSLQVLALLYMAELQAPLLNRLDPELDHAGPWNDPDQHQTVLTWVCRQVEAFGLVYDDLFGEEPSYQAAKATARALAALV